MIRRDRPCPSGGKGLSGAVRILGKHGLSGHFVTLQKTLQSDPAWKNGEYTEPPRFGLVGATNILMMMTSSPLQWHKQYPTRDGADR